jgi:Ca2+-binding EF-hand superfamily protein
MLEEAANSRFHGYVARRTKRKRRRRRIWTQLRCSLQPLSLVVLVFFLRHEIPKSQAFLFYHHSRYTEPLQAPVLHSSARCSTESRTDRTIAYPFGGTMRQPLMRRHLISMPSLLEDYSDVTTANIKNISPPSFSGESFTPSNGSLVYHTITSRDMDYIRQPESNANEHTYKDTSTPFPPLLMPQQGPPRRGLFNFLFRRQKGKKNASSSRSLWRPRHARSAEEGIRREPELLLAEERDKGSGSDQSNTLNRKSSARRLSSVLAKASVSIEKTSRRMAARTLTGLITALAEEVVDLDVEVDARDDTPYYNKHITAVRIRFARLGFKPLRIGGHDTAQSRRPPSLDDNQSLLLNSFRRRSALDQKLMGVSTWNDDDEYDEVIEQRNGELLSKPPMTADEAFDHIDADKSGYLDRNELVQALTLAARSNVDNVQLQEEIESESNLPILEKLASDLFELYDINGDGVVDRKEYKTMVEDMAALRKAQHLREQKRKAHASDDGRGDRDIASRWSDAAMEFVHNNTGFINSGIEFVQNKTSFLSTGMEFVQNKSEFLTSGLNFVQGYAGWLPWRSVEPNESTLNASSTKSHDVDSARTSDGAVQVVDSPELVESMSKSLGSITFSDVKMDLRRLFFGAIPILKHIVPGGPLILEPFTTTITGSFDRYDIMNSVLLDAGLRRLVMRALRRRVGFLRDFLEGAMFKGRSWKTYNGEGPRVDIPELTNVEFDSNDKLIITGRARVKTTPDSPVIEQSFKVRTSIGTRKDGRFIRLEKPELALVIECPKVWDAKYV